MNTFGLKVYLLPYEPLLSAKEGNDHFSSICIFQIPVLSFTSDVIVCVLGLVDVQSMINIQIVVSVIQHTQN